MKAFTLRIRNEDDATALLELERFTGSRTRSKAVWEAIRNYPSTSSLYDNLIEESHEAEWRYLRLLEALNDMQNARERLDREIATGMKIRGQLSLEHRMQSEAMASAAMLRGGYESIDDLPHESDDEEARRQKREGGRRTVERRRRRPGRRGR